MDRGYAVKRKQHPKDAASIWSILTFTYIHPYIKAGNKKDLNDDDISQVWSQLKAKTLGDKMEELWNTQKPKKGKKKSILKLLIDCFVKRYLLIGLLQLFIKIVHVALTPYSVGKLVNYFKEDQTEVSKNDAWFYGGIVIFTSTMYLFYEHHYVLLKNEMGFKIVTSLCTMVYRKSLKLSPSTILQITPGRIVTAITKDVIPIEDACYFMNDLWVELIQACVVMYLLYIRLGESGIMGLSIVLITVVIQLYVSKIVFQKRQDANSKTDERLQLTQEVITAIRVLKMYAWEKFFAKKIIDSRKIEIRKLRTLTVLKFFASFLGNLCNKLSFLSVILLYIWFGNSLTAEVVYYITICFQKLRRTISFIIPVCCGTLAEFKASLERIETILLADEIDYVQQSDHSVIIPKVEFVSANIGICKAEILKDINMKLRPGLNVLIGPVGCGKSSLLKAILQEYIVSQGKINVEGTISYSPQNPWLFPSSIKQNIIFGQSYNETKYKEVLDACALSFDLDGLAEGDETILSDCGVNLSKGQQARVNIARALYKESDIYIFDDSLSSLDGHVKNYIFVNSIKEYLRNKLVILATHDTKFVSKADNVIIMLEGTVTYSGEPMGIPPKLHQSLESLDKDLCESDVENDLEIKDVDEQKPCNENTELITKNCSSTKANVYHESIKTGSIGWSTYNNYFHFGGGFIVFFIVFALYVLVEASVGISEKLLSKWILFEEDMSRKNKFGKPLINTTVSSLLTSMSSNLSMIEEVFTERTYFNWTFNTTPNIVTNTTTDLMTLAERMLNNFEKRQNYIHYYSFLVLVSCFLVFMATSLFFVFSLKISKNLHKSMITNVLFGKLEFFDNNMSGNIINRFSKDLYCVDEWIPYIINEAIRMVTLMTSTGILIATLSQFFSGMTLCLVVIFYFACRYCIRPARTMRRIEMASRSPMIGHINATLEGLITIRAYGTQDILVHEFDKHHDHFMASHHLFDILIRCLAFSLHMLSAVFISIIILYFLMRSGSKSSEVGLAITQSFILSNFLDWGLRQWVMLESIMTSFQRSEEYTNVEQENKTGLTLKNWPSEGSIEYRDVSLTYRKNNETVLKNLNFKINPHEKVGIVGRTGAGKSSIIVTLFRLYEVVGEILIDGVNIKTLNLEYLRDHIGIIPQDPILFSGTVRQNVDPLTKHSDAEIWQALAAVNLKVAINDLDEDVHETGLTYSVGQRQLLCLARAIIRKTRIIILDEATANMDEDTDHFIHNKIGEVFENCTMIIVAHRLHSVLRCDQVIVMDKGEIVEFDSPNNLIGNKDSVFYKMIHHNDNS